MKASLTKLPRIFILTVGIFLLTNCGSNSLYSPSASVTPEESISIAQAYCDHQWVPSAQHIFHGSAPDGIVIHTPDNGYNQSSWKHRGWWKPAMVNTGIPYKWGGFDTPESFDQKINSGVYAGDSYTQQKRNLLEHGVSKYTCGVDCSGFISRCWRLSRPYSTRELPSICHRLSSYDDLKAGDILNKHNAHVLLFYKYANASKTRMIVYQAGAPPISKTERFIETTSYLKNRGFIPYRYKNMRHSVNTPH